MKDMILIIGMGITGHNLYKELKSLTPDYYDIKEGFENKLTSDTYEYIFICVDTPYKDKDKVCDISAIEVVIKEWQHKLTATGMFIVKSTILPHTTEYLCEKYLCRIIYSPEYYGNTQHCNNFDFNFTILGGCEIECHRAQQLLQKVYDGRHIFRIVDSKTAELVKYMENCYLAMKVSFCNQFAEIANKNGINYEDLRELFILDPRVNPSHTFVYNNKPYWDSHCLNKDVRAITETQDAPLLEAVIEYNNSCKISI